MAKNLNIDSWVLHNNKMVSAELDIRDLEEDRITASKSFKEHVNSKYQHFGSLETFISEKKFMDLKEFSLNTAYLGKDANNVYLKFLNVIMSFSISIITHI